MLRLPKLTSSSSNIIPRSTHTAAVPCLISNDIMVATVSEDDRQTASWEGELIERQEGACGYVTHVPFYTVNTVQAIGFLSYRAPLRLDGIQPGLGQKRREMRREWCIKMDGETSQLKTFRYGYVDATVATDLRLIANRVYGEAVLYYFLRTGLDRELVATH